MGTLGVRSNTDHLHVMVTYQAIYGTPHLDFLVF